MTTTTLQEPHDEATLDGPDPAELLDVWGHGSFPASDPPANW